MVGLPGCWRPVTLVTRDPSSCLLCGVFPIPKSLHQAFPHHWVWKVSPHFSLCCQEFWVQMNWCASGLGPKARLLPCFPERPQLRSRSLALTGYKCRPNLVDDLDCFKGHGILWVKWTSLLAVSLISWEMATLHRAPSHIFNPCLLCQGLCVVLPCMPAGHSSTNQLRLVPSGTECHVA